MGRFFRIDNPFFVFLGRIADLMILNIITLILCVPIITAGAAITADYYCCLKIRRDEDSGLLKMYFRSFRENFGQSTILMLIVLAILAVPTYLVYVVNNIYVESVPSYIKVMLYGAVLLATFLTAFVFPIQSRFNNTVVNTLKSSIILAFTNPFRTLAMIIITVLPFYLTYNFLVLLPAIMLFGISLPAFCSVLMYNKQFLQMEQRVNEAMGIPEPGSEDEHIFEEHNQEND